MGSQRVGNNLATKPTPKKKKKKVKVTSSWRFYRHSQVSFLDVPFKKILY